jgi:hypothetical protein
MSLASSFGSRGRFALAIPGAFAESRDLLTRVRHVEEHVVYERRREIERDMPVRGPRFGVLTREGDSPSRALSTGDQDRFRYSVSGRIWVGQRHRSSISTLVEGVKRGVIQTDPLPKIE